MRPKEWTDVLQIVRSAFNNAPSPRRGDVSTVTSFTGLADAPPIATFLRSFSSSANSVDDAQRERAVNIPALRSNFAPLHPVL